MFAAIDSTLPYIWLPIEACDLFANQFNLTYDNNTDLYVVNDTAHKQLLATNPTVTFKLGTTLYDGTFQNIELPYAAFDLQASYPLYENATNYFPIRRAANDTQYTLGRTFLQEAYIIVDHERHNFTIAQANFSANMPDSQIVSILSPAYDTQKNNTIEPIEQPSPALSSGAIAGIVIGAVLAVTLVLVALFFYLRKRKSKTHSPVPSTDTDTHPTENKTQIEAPTPFNDNELPADVTSSRHELPTPEYVQSELEGETVKWGRGGVQELHSDMSSPELHGRPLGGLPSWARKVEGSPRGVFELSGSEPADRPRR